MITTILCLCIGYLVGSLSSAIVVCRLLQLPDPREKGSGNPGTTNVLRLGGKKAALFTLLGDVVKGTVPVLVAMIAGLPAFWVATVGLVAMCGHLWPVFFQFKGGKGFATFLGVLLGLSWPLTLLAIALWLLVAAITRYSSLAALITTALAPIVFLIGGHIMYILPILAMSILLWYRHINNIQRLRDGTESKIQWR
ncbi:MAG: glycerol-3-phosphate 1-O-acyltransferase PlsY [Gammaproteobacteria bacterium]